MGLKHGRPQHRDGEAEGHDTDLMAEKLLRQAKVDDRGEGDDPSHRSSPKFWNMGPGQAHEGVQGQEVERKQGQKAEQAVSNPVLEDLVVEMGLF